MLRTILLCALILAGCKSRDFNNASEAQKSKGEADAEFVKGFPSLATGPLLMSEVYKPKHFTLLMMAGGIITLMGAKAVGDGILHQPEKVMETEAEVDVSNISNFKFHVVVSVFSTQSSAAAIVDEIKFSGITRLMLLASAGVLSVESFAFTQEGRRDRVRLDSIAMSRKAPQYDNATFASSYNSLESSSKSMKELFKNTFTADEFKQMNREAERKLASTPSKIVDPSGKLLNDDFIQLAFLSEHLQGNKTGFNTKEFVKEVQIAATLPHDLPSAEFEAQQKKFKDPVAKNIFINRRAFRQMGWM